MWNSSKNGAESRRKQATGVQNGRGTIVQLDRARKNKTKKSTGVPVVPGK